MAAVLQLSLAAIPSNQYVVCDYGTEFGNTCSGCCDHHCPLFDGYVLSASVLLVRSEPALSHALTVWPQRLPLALQLRWSFKVPQTGCARAVHRLRRHSRTWPAPWLIKMPVGHTSVFFHPF